MHKIVTQERSVQDTLYEGGIEVGQPGSNRWVLGTYQLGSLAHTNDNKGDSCKDHGNTLDCENEEIFGAAEENNYNTATIEDINDLTRSALVCQVMSDKGLPIHNKQSDMGMRKSSAALRSSETMK